MAISGYEVWDADIHCLEPADLWLRYADRKFRDKVPKPQSHDSGLPGRLSVMGKTIPAFLERVERQEDFFLRYELADKKFRALGRVHVPDDGTSPKSMLAAMDLEGIDAGVVFRTDAAHAIAHDDMEDALAAEICRAYNNWVSEFCGANRRRLSFAAQIPLHNVTLAVEEARRAVAELGAVALCIPSNPVRSRVLYDPYYDSIWAIAQSLNVPIAVHGIQLAYQDHIGKRFIDNFALMHAAGHSAEIMLAMGAMLTGGVFARFPQLRAVFLEGQCSWLPAWLYCLDDRWDKFGNFRRFGLRQRPSEYFRTQCFVSMDPGEHLVETVFNSLGDANIVFASDWPHHDSLYPHATKTFLSLGVPPISRERVLAENAKRLYRG